MHVEKIAGITIGWNSFLWGFSVTNFEVVILYTDTIQYNYLILKFYEIKLILNKYNSWTVISIEV